MLVIQTVKEELPFCFVHPINAHMCNITPNVAILVMKLSPLQLKSKSDAHSLNVGLFHTPEPVWGTQSKKPMQNKALSFFSCFLDLVQDLSARITGFFLEGTRNQITCRTDERACLPQGLHSRWFPIHKEWNKQKTLRRICEEDPWSGYHVPSHPHPPDTWAQRRWQHNHHGGSHWSWNLRGGWDSCSPHCLSVSFSCQMRKCKETLSPKPKSMKQNLHINYLSVNWQKEKNCQKEKDCHESF